MVKNKVDAAPGSLCTPVSPPWVSTMPAVSGTEIRPAGRSRGAAVPPHEKPSGHRGLSMWLPGLARRGSMASPAEADPEQRFRAALLVGFALFEIVVTSLVCITEFLWGTPAFAWLYAVTSFVIVLVLWRYFRGGRLDPVANTFMAVLFIAGAITNIGSGGRAIGVNIALPTLVLVAVLVLPPLAGRIWTVLALLQILLVAWLRRSAYPFPFEPDPEWVSVAIDRVPAIMTIAAALIATVAQRSLRSFRLDLERSRETEAHARAEAVASAARFEDFARQAADGFWETDSSFLLTYVSPSFAHLMGMTVEEMLGRTPEAAYRRRYPGAPDLAPYMDLFHKRLPVASQHLWTIDRDGRKRRLLNHGLPVFDPAGAFAGYRGTVTDITEREQLVTRLTYLAERDSLTELLNRRAMLAAIDDALADPSCDERGCWVCYVDLDRFKELNDRAGHAAGDAALCAAAAALRDCTRDGDKAGHLGGDEFCVLLVGVDPLAAENVAARILDRLGQSFVEVDGSPVGIQASIGLARLRAGEDRQTLLRRVDGACYASKRNGRNRLTIDRS
jgi:diguanylate cyclase (GGDEF)-like protein/PAS domain S-box-containing protein